MTTGDADHQRLAEAIEARRNELRLRWDAIAEGAGITAAQLRKFRAGASGVRNGTREGLERMLRWKAGAFDRILAGQDPIPLSEDTTTEATAAVDQEDDEIRPILQRTKFGAVIFFASDHDQEEILRKIEALIANDYGTTT